MKLTDKAIEKAARAMSIRDGDLIDWTLYRDEARAPLATDVRGGYCGSTTEAATCLAPLAFGQCANHGERHK